MFHEWVYHSLLLITFCMRYEVGVKFLSFFFPYGFLVVQVAFVEKTLLHSIVLFWHVCQTSVGYKHVFLSGFPSLSH